MTRGQDPTWTKNNMHSANWFRSAFCLFCSALSCCSTRFRCWKKKIHSFELLSKISLLFGCVCSRKYLNKKSTKKNSVIFQLNSSKLSISIRNGRYSKRFLFSVHISFQTLCQIPKNKRRKKASTNRVEIDWIILDFNRTICLACALSTHSICVRNIQTHYLIHVFWCFVCAPTRVVAFSFITTSGNITNGFWFHCNADNLIESTLIYAVQKNGSVSFHSKLKILSEHSE